MSLCGMLIAFEERQPVFTSHLSLQDVNCASPALSRKRCLQEFLQLFTILCATPSSIHEVSSDSDEPLSDLAG